MIQQIFTIINNINQIYTLKIRIIKVRSHILIKGNEIADKLAKKAASIAVNARIFNDYYNGEQAQGQKKGPKKPLYYIEVELGKFH